MASWFGVVMLVLPSLVVSVDEGATIECACTTQDCQMDSTPSCLAKNVCYVQYMPYANDPDNPEDSFVIVRGCIDTMTPLLCENRRPLVYSGSWPILHCCNEDWCNKDVLPTLPPWVDDIEEKYKHPDADNTQGEDGDDRYPSHHRREEHSEMTGYVYPERENGQRETGEGKDFQNEPLRDNKSHGKMDTNSQRRRRTINPLYIAVPIVGACIFLALVIFAIYILKRQNRAEDYHYQGNLKQQTCVLQPCVIEHLKPTSSSSLPSNAGGGPVKPYLPSDCERSSSGSETRLLMKV